MKQDKERQVALAATDGEIYPTTVEWVAYHLNIAFPDITLFQNMSCGGTDRCLANSNFSKFNFN